MSIDKIKSIALNGVFSLWLEDTGCKNNLVDVYI